MFRGCRANVSGMYRKPILNAATGGQWEADDEVQPAGRPGAGADRRVVSGGDRLDDGPAYLVTLHER
jgi:hypothetical protein